MIDTNSDTTQAGTGAQDFLPRLRGFLGEHGVALENAAGVLGGS